MIALTLRLLAPFLVVGVLILLLRWTFGHGRSLTEREPKSGRPDDYGLLVPVASPADPEEALRLGALLDEAGIRHTVVDTTSGPRVMVWEDDVERARRILH